MRHARGSNQIAVLNELRETRESPEFLTATHFVLTRLAEKMNDPEFSYQIEHGSSRTPENAPLIDYTTTLGNSYEAMAMMIRKGFVDQELALEINRRRVGRILWENFRYLTVLSEDWLAEHAAGTYPPQVRRIDLDDVWLSADLQYAASRP